MKIRSGFVSNSSSSSFIVFGFSSEDYDEMYDMVEKKIEEEDPYLSEKKLYWEIQNYLERYGIDYCHKGDWEYNRTEGIGCILEEGSIEEFNESLKKAEDALKKFDEEHHTDFARNSKIFSAYEENY
ncbi:MAG: hypothetical protein ACI4SI_03255 [Candidatus Ornithospirochaeta sp.]